MYACIHVTPSCGDRNRFRYVRYFKLVFWGVRESVDQLMNLASPHIGISVPIPRVIAALGSVPGVSNLLIYLLSRQHNAWWDSKKLCRHHNEICTNPIRSQISSFYIHRRTGCGPLLCDTTHRLIRLQEKPVPKQPIHLAAHRSYRTIPPPPCHIVVKLPGRGGRLCSSIYTCTHWQLIITRESECHPIGKTIIIIKLMRWYVQKWKSWVDWWRIIVRY